MSFKLLAATTSLLPNGHQFTADDLHQIATDWGAQLRGGWPFLVFDQHRPGRPAWARIVGLSVIPHPSEAGILALQAELEALPGVSQERVEERLGMGGLSMAFLGPRCSTPGNPAMMVGMSPELVPTDQELEELYDALRAELPDVPLGVARYHQHAAHPPTTLLLVVSAWVAEQIAGKLFDRLWQCLFPPRSPRPFPDRVQIEVRTAIGSPVTVETTFTGEVSRVKVALEVAVAEAKRYEQVGNSMVRVSVDFDDSGTPTRYETPVPHTLPPGALLGGGESLPNG